MKKLYIKRFVNAQVFIKAIMAKNVIASSPRQMCRVTDELLCIDLRLIKMRV